MSAGKSSSGAQVPLTDSDRIGWATGGRVSSGGSIGTLGITSQQGQEAEGRRGPLGFSASVNAVVSEILEEKMDALERQLRDIGECLWTARDTVAVLSFPDGRQVVGFPLFLGGSAE